ncbi:hypothetical protein CYMTET_47157 [Cymbomonas tetramitiformis]|uniref:Uncharacterized protein n=1 Tax=Cymbomonas tetramitiformis TaxID=36881 RepID=A0AAE0EWH1_9CHLO|nr:hypothetical protein CYMTET_47157 [Cymbomonas tetramitiformis]
MHPLSLLYRARVRCLAVCVLTLLSASEATGSACRRLTTEEQAEKLKLFDEWATIAQERLGSRAISRKRKIFEHRILGDSSACLDPASRPPPDPASRPPPDPASRPPQLLAPPPKLTKNSHTLHPPTPRGELSTEWRCIPDATHRRFVPDAERWETTCRADFESQEPWAFRDPYVEGGESRRGLEEWASLLPGKIVAVIGDSVMQQWMDAIDCESNRNGLKGHVPPWMQKILQGSGSTKPVTLKNPNTNDRSLDLHLFYRGDRLFKPEEMASILNYTDILVFNFGLHYHDMIVYNEEMTKLAKQLDDWIAEEPANRYVFFRETSAQHFQGMTGSGDYDSRDQFRNKSTACGCVEIQTPDAQSAWWQDPESHKDGNVRNKAAHSIFGGRPNTGIFKFFDATFPRYNMHHETLLRTEKMQICDCTHMCYSPSFWTMVHQQFYEAVSETLKKGSSGGSSR